MFIKVPLFSETSPALKNSCLRACMLMVLLEYVTRKSFKISLKKERYKMIRLEIELGCQGYVI